MTRPAKRVKRKTLEPDWATHPGEHIQELLEHHGMTQAALARKLGLTTKTVSMIVNRKAPVRVRTAIKLGKWRYTPMIWMSLQANYDLHMARKRT